LVWFGQVRSGLVWSGRLRFWEKLFFFASSFFPPSCVSAWIAEICMERSSFTSFYAANLFGPRAVEVNHRKIRIFFFFCYWRYSPSRKFASSAIALHCYSSCNFLF
jgi:hypothetical protein